MHYFREGQDYHSDSRVISEQPGVSNSQLARLPVRISLPHEEDEYDEDEAEQAHMMGFDIDDEHEMTARARVTPQVQRAQSELVPDRRASAQGMVQRSMSESRG